MRGLPYYINLFGDEEILIPDSGVMRARLTLGKYPVKRVCWRLRTSSIPDSGVIRERACEGEVNPKVPCKKGSLV